MNRWTICTLGTTEILLHPAMLLYGLYAVLTGHGVFILISTLSILLHEGAHAGAACLMGKPPRCIELTPLGAVMRLEDEDRLSPIKRMFMLLAGPAMTLLLCFAAIILTKQGSISLRHGRIAFMSNLSILLLNLLPALPLDGGRILTLMLSMLLPMRHVYQIMRGIGTLLGIGMVALNVITSWKFGGWNLSLAFAGCCLLYTSAVATTTYAMAELRQFMERKIRLERKGCVSSWICVVLTMQQVCKLVKRLPPNQWAIYLCLEEGSMKYVGWMTEHELIQVYLTSPEAKVADVLAGVADGEKSAYFDTN